MSKYVQTLNRLRDEAEGSADPADATPSTTPAAGDGERDAQRRASVDREIRRAAALDGSDALFDRLRALAVEGIGAIVIAGAVPTRSVAAIGSSLVSQAERRGLAVLRAEVREPVGRTAVVRALGRGAPGSLKLDLHDEAGVEQLRRWRCDAQADLLVVEAAPLSTGADAALLARATDGLVLVAESLVTDRTALAESTERARATGCRLLGVVLDRTRDHSPRWFDRLIG